MKTALLKLQPKALNRSKSHVVQLVKSVCSNCRAQNFESVAYFSLMLMSDTEQFLISEKLSINKLNPWETGAWADTQLFLHVSSQGGEIMARSANITGTEITSFSSNSPTWQRVSFPEKPSGNQAIPESCDFLFTSCGSLVIRQRENK